MEPSETCSDRNSFDKGREGTDSIAGYPTIRTGFDSFYFLPVAAGMKGNFWIGLDRLYGV